MRISNFRRQIEEADHLMPAQWTERHSTPQVPFSREDVDRWIHDGRIPYTKFFNKFRAIHKDQPLPAPLKEYCRVRESKHQAVLKSLQQREAIAFDCRRENPGEHEGETPAL